MRQYLNLYSSREQFYKVFDAQVKQKVARLVRMGIKPKQAKKAVKRDTWKILKTIQTT